MQLLKCMVGMMMMGSSYVIANRSVDIINSFYQGKVASNDVKMEDMEGIFLISLELVVKIN
ncbi:hypothetical protein NK214_03560 [Chromobacterium sp. S0633]|uniref:hypothetical protein n=1 Tax=Chromobacterium sp. S0633 TaxID=2957805 RepID=UPI00209F44E9|nr:hypothetical protein [Chromobacterium sp. S0633]MCP1289257.1 hypothetical protein [Chromobacterium sp. S0633]